MCLCILLVLYSYSYSSDVRSGSLYVTQVVPNASYSAGPMNAIWRLSAWPLQKQIMQLIHGDNRDYDQALRFTVLV